MKRIAPAIILSIVIASPVASCGGKVARLRSCSNPVKLEVSSQGVTLHAKSVTTLTSDDGPVVDVSSFDDACGVYYGIPREFNELQIFLKRDSRVGTYLVSRGWWTSPDTVGAWLSHTPATGAMGYPQAPPDDITLAISGIVELTHVNNDDIAGSFDIAFPDGAHASGLFDSPTCRANSQCFVAP